MLYISVAARLQGNEENYFWKCCLSLQIKIGYQLIFNCVNGNECNYVQVMYELITEDREFRVRSLKF